MDCTKNEFCASLSEATRKKLCVHCRRRLTKAGSIQLYNDFERHATLLLDGVVSSSEHMGEDVLDYSSDVPAFYLGLPGRMLATNVTFKKLQDEHYAYNGMEFLTDCCVATFEHSLIRELFDTDNNFARGMALSMIRIMEDTCEVSAILRAHNVYLSVNYLMQYLIPSQAYFTQQQIATIVNHDRASVSKAMARIKRDRNEHWEVYHSQKGRVVTMCDPAG